ncbi:ATP-binding cassette, sub-family D [Cyanidioschyzon merolae strain 10D]|uniref:Probable ATP-dependent transporter ycf16 n=1 Tax=Cyanidioschyzon merolae (strain NIES-3377 / 10D) TaxID=280699 RepID=M1UUW8_CYAM1|nr:ATP-binding cassette, sub-family D [Cyanidioschyzon merolae strain 10D]BAM81696.1 ATP-binding cassette, sub-family D [Cyanidioschyzon merolae strain 10D]|eukprot:XP_005537732.1 ATP-binding cassette, sub-family D [Cyanidioschyzon merolae strain 10D]
MPETTRLFRVKQRSCGANSLPCILRSSPITFVFLQSGGALTQGTARSAGARVAFRLRARAALSSLAQPARLAWTCAGQKQVQFQATCSRVGFLGRFPSRKAISQAARRCSRLRMAGVSADGQARLQSRRERAIALLKRLKELAVPFWTEPSSRNAAWRWTLGTLALAFVCTLYAVSLSFIQRFFWNALNAKDAVKYQKFLVLYVAALIAGPPFLTLFEWMRQRTALVWRRFLTERLLGGYFHDRKYYTINILRLQNNETVHATPATSAGGVRVVQDALDNVDQRISEDIRAFTERAVGFGCTVVIALFDFLLFSVILFRIRAQLFLLLVLYSTIGTAVTLWLGGRLVHLNFAQLRREADFRYALVRVRENAESIAFYGGEEQEQRAVSRRFRALFDNMIQLLRWQRNVTFATTWYRYLIQVVPALVVSRDYFSGRIPLGALSQAFFSYNHVLNDLSLVVNEFVGLSAFAAAVNRLYELHCAVEPRLLAGQRHERDAGSQADTEGIVTLTGNGTAAGVKPAALRLEKLTIYTPEGRRRLVDQLDLMLEDGARILLMGESGVGKSSTVRAIAGLWKRGSGVVYRRPHPRNTLFVPQRPYLMLGTLRENLFYPLHGEDAANVDEKTIRNVLVRVNLPDLVDRLGGLDVEADFAAILSLGEQQRLAFARLLLQPEPVQLAILDESTSGLDVENERRLYELLREMGISVLSVGNRPTLIRYHNQVIRLFANGSWQIESPSEAVEHLLGSSLLD